jgi:hypothetical protein
MAVCGCGCSGCADQLQCARTVFDKLLISTSAATTAITTEFVSLLGRRKARDGGSAATGVVRSDDGGALRFCSFAAAAATIFERGLVLLAVLRTVEGSNGTASILRAMVDGGLIAVLGSWLSGGPPTQLAPAVTESVTMSVGIMAGVLAVLPQLPLTALDLKLNEPLVRSIFPRSYSYRCSSCFWRRADVRVRLDGCGCGCEVADVGVIRLRGCGCVLGFGGF